MSHNPVLHSFLKWEKETPDHIFLRQPVNGKWHEWTFRQSGNEIRKMASGLLSMNLPAHSNVAILSKNCAHWIMADLAIMMAGFVSVPLYASISASSIRQILEHSQSKAIFIGKLDEYEKQKEGIPASILKISIDFYGITEGELISQWNATRQPLEKTYDWGAEELLTVMYTSGTTGRPKGVMFHSSAFRYVSKIMIDYLNRVNPLPAHPVLFSYLPLCHIAERDITEVLGCEIGASISFVESLETFGRDLNSVQPHVFFGVPRIWARFQEKILEKLPQQKLSRLLKIPFIRSVLKQTLKKKLGLSRALLKISGAAPMPLFLLNWFHQLGIDVREIYGMTENCAISHGNQEEVKFGSVGKAMPTAEIKFTDQEEILTRHAALMMGYYREPEMTREAFTPDGFLKTGDLGQTDADGFVFITGRVKDQFKTDKGKYVSPSPIEMRLLKNSDIEQVCVVGVSIPQPIALTILSEAGKQKSRSEIDESLLSSLNEVNQLIEDYERLKKAVILKNDWTIENGLLTPTLKVKRNEVEKIHLPNYPNWYAQKEIVVWEEAGGGKP
ncbi:MAG: Long-chain-fatty-acid--CoA ligase [Cytophagales bacterium]|jgi:long-chain acyl-CoA synthetase|nr:AMP-binding protein [Bacteroidota bacterium]MBS1981877.1 AMP-binding protein [Bacteroidota bacterium]WHZ07500.1 MAG: Long-chain-fatty-acid--CoA ligase [Cytophagales bacterium]